MNGSAVVGKNPTLVEPTRVWQSVGAYAIEHLVALDITLCGQRPWSATTDPRVDPTGNNTEDVWFSDHELPESEIIECTICKAAAKPFVLPSPNELNPGQRSDLIGRLQHILWLDLDDEGNDEINPDKEWSSDTLDSIGQVMHQANMGPRRPR